MIHLLPFQLSEGVTATREGLRISIDAPVAMATLLAACGHEKISTGLQTVIGWPDAAEILRYREGEPWVQLMKHSLELGKFAPFLHLPILHRLAAILCDGYAEFEVLHACIQEFGV